VVGADQRRWISDECGATAAPRFKRRSGYENDLVYEITGYEDQRGLEHAAANKV
jgi:hypothetical protein